MKKLNLILAVVVLSLANLSFGQTLYWDGGTVNLATNGDAISQGAAGTWNTSIQNWDQGNGLAHIAWSSSTNAVFGAPAIAAGSGTVTVAAPVTVGTLIITSTNYVINDNGTAANTITLNGVTNSAAATIGANLVNATTFTKDGPNGLSATNANTGLTGSITINAGQLTLGNTATTTAPNSFGNVSLVVPSSSLGLQSGANITYSQTISGNGSVAITAKNSGTTVILSGNNTYTNTTSVIQANLQVSSIDETGPNNLGTGPLQIGNNSSATAFTYGFPGGDVTTARPLIFGGTGGPTINNTSSGRLTLAGPVSFAANATAAKGISLGGNMPSIFAGVIPDNITVTATNPTSIILKHTAAYWMLTASNTFSGGVQFYGGVVSPLLITNDFALGNITNTITFTTNGSTSASSGEIDSTNFPVTLAATRKINFTGPNGGGAPTAGFKTADANSLTVASYITGIGHVKRQSSSSSLAGAVRFSCDTNDFTGSFSTGYGTTEFTSVANSGTPSALGQGITNAGVITIGNSSSAANLRYVGVGTSSTTRAINWSGTTGGFTLDASGGGTIQYLASASLKSGSGNSSLSLQGTNAGNNTLAQVINDSGGTTTLFKSGTGKWILTGANTFSGATTVSGGTLSVSADNNLGTAPGSATPGSLTLNGGALSASASFTLNANRGLALGPTGTNSSGGMAAGNGTIDVTNGATLAYAGIAANTTSTNIGGLIKTGGGTLTLSGANTYTGNTTISAGTLALSGSGTLGASNLVIAAGATFDVSALGGGYSLAASQTLQALVGATATINGSLNLAAASVLVTNVINTPIINVTGGTLTLGATTPFTVEVNNGGTALGTGSYKLISKGTGGSVAGTAPASVTVGGNGLASGATASLSISNNELYLVVSGGTPSTPVIGSLGAAAGQAVMTFSGTNGTWYVLSATNVALPISAWTTNATGTFSGTGSTVNFTNAAATDLQRFYRIKVQ
jgi:fibronectin-binding autotransporter adhesin